MPFCAAALLVSCGGGTGSKRDSGIEKTHLRVEATDENGDTLRYQWRVTAGTVENRNARETVWTMPGGPGLHFAYVSVSDGKGGHVEQQYAVATDTFATDVPARAAVSHTAPPVQEFAGGTARLRFRSGDPTFAEAGQSVAQRFVYLPDVQVQVVDQAGVHVFAGVSDAAGEVVLPKLKGGTYNVRCATQAGAPLQLCKTITVGENSLTEEVKPLLPKSQNLRLHGHVALADGASCGRQSEFFLTQSTATVQLLQGTQPLTPVMRVNRYGDYAIDAAVPVHASLTLRVQCERQSEELAVPQAPATGYASSSPLRLDHVFANHRPRIVRVAAHGPDGNMRGQMVEPETGASSRKFPDSDHFLTFKGSDTRLSACMYYRAIGAVGDCDASGNMIAPLTLKDWKRKHRFKPYQGTNTEVSADYINKMDLNLVRRMTATRNGPESVAFYVCNHPGPEGQTQREVDEVMARARAGERHVACVAMEWTVTPGTNNDRPFTKFLTFGPDGSLLRSVNLDGRGEKYLPGACVACHGGSQYAGRFPDKGAPSPNLGSSFLGFDTANYAFSTDNRLTEAAQTEALYRLNQLVAATQPSPATQALINGWYAHGTLRMLDKEYVPEVWRQEESISPGASEFYRRVVATSCRTCHAAMSERLDWDGGSNGRPRLLAYRGSAAICGGGPDVAVNASMPNALAAHDRLLEKARRDPHLASLMQTFLGCEAPRQDPLFHKR